MMLFLRSLLVAAFLYISSSEAATIEMELTSHLGDNVIFHQGDKIRFLLTINQDAYLYVFYQDAVGKLHTLLPTSKAPPQYVQAGWFIPVPGPQFQFQVAEPYGDEKLVVLALSRRLPELEIINEILATSLQSITARFQEVAIKNKIDIGVVEARFRTELN